MSTSNLYSNPDMQAVDWQPIEDLIATVPAQVKPWLILPNSLTAALKAIATDFNVHVIEESFVELTPDLQRYFPATESARCFSRKVLLRNQEQAWVAAHTLIPEVSLDNQLRAFSGLQQRPLGELLFADPTVTKDSLEIAQHQNVWGRRARYWLRNQPLLVCEFFFNELLHHE